MQTGLKKKTSSKKPCTCLTGGENKQLIIQKHPSEQAACRCFLDVPRVTAVRQTRIKQPKAFPCMGKDISQGQRDALGTHLKRFSAPARILISLLICWLIRARRCCSLLRWVWAKGSQPCWEKGTGSHHGIVAALPIPPPSPDVPQIPLTRALPHAEALGWGQIFNRKKINQI